MRQVDWRKAHIFADKCLEFIGIYFTESFESCNFRIFAAFLYGCDPLSICVTIVCTPFASGFPDPEKRCFEYVKMTFSDEFFKKPQKVRDHQISDMESINISICGKDYFLVTKVVNAVADIQGTHQIIQFFIFIECFPAAAACIEWLASQ